MEESKNKRSANANREKCKKKSLQEKKTKSETAPFNTSSIVSSPPNENFIVVGKGCCLGKSKSEEFSYRLHECYSETDISPLPKSSKNLRDFIQGEGLQNVASNSSFISAKSEVSDICQKKIHDLEDALSQQVLVIDSLKKQIGDRDVSEVKSVSTETDFSFTNIEDHRLKLKALEKKVNSKEKKIKEFEQNLEECSRARDFQIEENKALKNQVSLLNRQIQSLFDLLKNKNWTTVSPTEFAKSKNKVTELESLVASQEREKNELFKKIRVLSSNLESKENELSTKSRELVEYKNRSTLEMCKLINQIDCLQKEAKLQSQLLDSKITEAQNSMDEELVNVTHKLEEQYQKDVKSAVEKFHSNFEKLAELPKSAIEKLLQFCEPDKIDIISYQKEWDKLQNMLEAKIKSLEENRCSEIKQLKDNYETKIVFLKTQIEALFSQLKERKDIIDIFENELKMYKSNSAMNLLKMSAVEDDISALRELYTAEIFSQKQIHKLQVSIFEEKVKTLTDEILYHAKNEEIRLQELENAKKMALTFREKYEKLVFDWEKKAEKDFKKNPIQTEITPELDTLIIEFQNLMQSLKISNQVHEDIVQKMTIQNEDEKTSLLQDIQDLKNKLQALKNFQKIQVKLDETINNLIETVGTNYSKTIKTFLLSHATELSLKQMEICASEKRHVAEIDALKIDHAKELEEIRSKVESSENLTATTENEDTSLRKIHDSEKVESLKREIEEISIELLKSEGIIAAKDETERALNKRIEELEKLIRLKEENCHKELEDITAKYLKETVLSSAKDDLAKELENELSESESLLMKSFEVVDRLIGICSNLQNFSSSTNSDEKEHQKPSKEVRNKFQEAKASIEYLKAKFLDAFERMDNLENVKLQNQNFMALHEKLQNEIKLCSKKNTALEQERNRIFEENNEMKKEISNLKEEIANKEKALAEISSLQKEVPKISEPQKKLEVFKLDREETEVEQKQSEFFEDTIESLMEQVDQVTAELLHTKVLERQEVFSISLQEVKFLYEEQEKTTPISNVACQVELAVSDLWKANEDLEKENKSLKSQLEEKKSELKTPLYEEAILKYKSIQKELSAAAKERDELIIVLKDSEREKDILKEKLEDLKKEKEMIFEKCETEVKNFTEKGILVEDSGRREMTREIERLNEYVKTLSYKIEVMKANNELLMSESQERIKLNQNLVSELEEAWSQRYEIEDQLAKVRRENELLDLRRRQLEETNKKISNLLAEGKPVLPWVKIHDTVETIVDEVLALKTSLNDSESESGVSAGFGLPTANSKSKFMTDNLHTQLKNKTLLCQEPAFQKETLRKELKNLGSFILDNDSKSAILSMNTELCSAKKEIRQPALCVSDEVQAFEREYQNLWEESETIEIPTLMTFSDFKEEQPKYEEAQFSECGELGSDKLKKKIQQMQDIQKEGKSNVCLKLIELKYEEEVEQLSREFKKEIEKLRKAFGSEKKNSQESCDVEIEKLKNCFEKKWADLEMRYAEIYNTQKQRVISRPALELDHILQELGKILLEEQFEEKTKIKIEDLLNNILILRNSEIKSVRERCNEVVTLLERKHASEIQKLQSVVLQLKENIFLALKKETAVERVDKEHQDIIAAIRNEYEMKLEDEKEKHEGEISAMEEFWTEKLSECETKCAIMKAAGERSAKIQEKTSDSCNTITSEIEETKTEQPNQEEKVGEENQIVKNSLAQNLSSDNYKLEESNTQGNTCISCLADQSLFKRMEFKTDDDKLDVIQQRDALEEMIFSMRNIITKLLTFIGQHTPELSNTAVDIDDTLYKSIHFDLDRTLASDMSVVSNSVLLTMDLSTVFQEIKDNSLLNSSDHIRFELEKCLKQLKNDANGLFTLSCTENASQNLNELVRKVMREKKELEAKVVKVEDMQNEMKKEISTTKERLSQWERNLEVVSEGYGEEIIEPKQIVSLGDFKNKLKAISTENCGHSAQDISLLEEICKEGERLQEEWMKEKCDLQQQGNCSNAKSCAQIDVADKQLHSLKKFLEEQAVEREQEREAFDREINKLQESLKAKEKDSSLQIRTNREVGRLSRMADDSIEALTTQIKDLSSQLTETKKNKEAVEVEFQNAVKKIWSLREVIQELELQLAEVSERESNLKKKIDKLDGLVEEHMKANLTLKDELEACRSQNDLKFSDHIKSLEEELVKLRQIADQVNPDYLTQLKGNLRQIEAILIKKTKDLEQLHVSSAHVSCSSPSEDISFRDHIDATRCSTPDEMCSNYQPLATLLPMEEIDRVQEKLARHSRAEEVTMKYIQDLKMQLRNNRKAYEEIQTERDILLEKIDVYLKENSSLKVRLEEQRCNAGLLQKQLNANLESQISQLEVDVEKLNDLCNEKDKQLREMKIMLENTTKSLKIRETEALNKSREENTLITTLKTDLANALNENEKLEEKLEKTKEKLRQTLKMPQLIDSMIDEKNAEIDRLEKEVAKLSSEKTTSGITSISQGSDDKQQRKIRFSEPESFSENISSISVHYLSDLRNCSDSIADFRNSSFKSRRPIVSSTKLESVSSIAPLQLSPRGASSFNWKTSSPILQNESANKSPLKTTSEKSDTWQMEEIGKLQGEVESKQREISELLLQIDILKRQLVEVNEEVAAAKSNRKEMEIELSVKDEEIRKLQVNEKNLLMTMDSLKQNHAEEIDELHNQLNFEHGKVEKVYEEIKALEVKKIEIEESFLSLKEDYNEKINQEKKTAEALIQQIRILETKNNESELRLAALEKELEKTIRESERTIETLSKKILALKTENEQIRSTPSQMKNAETQMDDELCVCQKSLSLEIPNTKEDVVPDLEELKAEFDKMAAVIGERDFNKKEAFLYAMAVRRLLSVVLKKVDELSKEVEAHMKRVMECSVDELAVKVQKELVLSAKLDNQLLSSIEANGFASKEATPQPDFLDSFETSYKETGGGDNKFLVPKPPENTEMLKIADLYKDMVKRMADVEKERENLEVKVTEQQKIIRLLEESLKKEKDRILEEKERCSEDAKIMELLRLNLEKRLIDIKAKGKELKKEKQQRMALEKELEKLRFSNEENKEWESRKFIELNAIIESQKEKLTSMGLMLEDEKKKNQELKLLVEEERIERAAEKNAQRLMETDLNLIREQKDSFKKELLNVRKLMHTRNVEIGLLKRKINLQEIDLKALSLASNPSEASSVCSNAGSFVDSPFSLLVKMRKLNSCVQHHVKESTEMGGALLHLDHETEYMKEIIRKLEEENETKLTDETLVPDTEVERRLWALEKERLVMDLETLKRENEVLKHDLIDTCKNIDALKQENIKLKKEIAPPKKEEVPSNDIEDVLLHERISHLTRKYMRTESYRKALAWQKHYLLITLQEYQRSEEEAWKRLGRRKRDGKRKEPKRCGRFRVVALAAVAVFRMKFIVKRWQKNALNHVISLLEAKTCKAKPAPLQSVLNIYNEPLNPLSYQTQHIFRNSSSQVLRTPPSRDPGLRAFSLDSKNMPDRMEKFDYIQESVGLFKGLP